MPAKPRWLLAIPDAIRQLEKLDRELLTRRDLERLFGVSKVRAVALMTAFGAGRTGHLLTLPRAELLRRHRRLAAFRGEETCRERVVTAIRKARLTGIRVAVPVEALEARLSGLPAGVSVEPGRIEVCFNGAKDAVGRLFALDVETHRAVFTWILQVLATAALIKGNTIGIDATMLEANAALRSIVRRETGKTYQEVLTRLAQASGIETPTRADLARVDRTRPKKGRNTDWQHPHDPDARITKMKDGRTHLAHKAEHAVDMETGAIVGVTVQGADQGDTTTIAETLTAAAEDLEAVAAVTDDDTGAINEVVADKGYHSNQVLTDLAALDLRSYIAEPDRGRRNWTKNAVARDAVYANRRRIRATRGVALLRRRSEHLERPNAHL